MTDQEQIFFKNLSIALQKLGADSTLLAIIGSWKDTLPDEDVVQMLENWNAGVDPFIRIIASRDWPNHSKN